MSFANPRMEISDIAERISMSSKTVARRLDKMIENRLVEFTIHCNPTAMRGYIISVVWANTEKGSYSRCTWKKVYLTILRTLFSFTLRRSVSKIWFIRFLYYGRICSGFSPEKNRILYGCEKGGCLYPHSY